jgi:hypothetical protein
MMNLVQYVEHSNTSSLSHEINAKLNGFISGTENELKQSIKPLPAWLKIQAKERNGFLNNRLDFSQTQS